MDYILTEIKRLVAWIACGASVTALLGYAALLAPWLQWGVVTVFAIANLFGLYLFIFHPQYRDEVLIGIGMQVIGALIILL